MTANVYKKNLTDAVGEHIPYSFILNNDKNLKTQNIDMKRSSLGATQDKQHCTAWRLSVGVHCSGGGGSRQLPQHSRLCSGDDHIGAMCSLTIVMSCQT